MKGEGGGDSTKGGEELRRAVFWCARGGKRFGSISTGNQKLREGIGKLL
jgi:hypothetical protein